MSGAASAVVSAHRSGADATPNVVDAGALIKGELLDLLQAVGRQRGISGSALDQLLWWIRRTRAMDWVLGNRAVVYLTVRETAALRGITVRQVNRLEREIAEAYGTYVPEPRCRRWGRRDETGRIVVANGVEVTPLRDALPDLRRAKAELDQMHERRRQRRDELAAARGRVRRLVDTVVAIGDATQTDEALRIAAPARVRIADSDTVQIEALERHILAAQKICCALEGVLLAGKSCGSDVDTSDTSDENVRHIHPLNDFHTPIQGGGSSDEDIAPPQPSVAGREPLALRERTADRYDGPPYVPPEATGADRVGVGRVVAAASPRFQDHLPPQGTLTPADVVAAALCVGAELGISHSAWSEACQIVGAYPAALCVLIADRATHDRGIASPGGYFRSMIRRAPRGELHIHRSIYGLSNPSHIGEKR